MPPWAWRMLSDAMSHVRCALALPWSIGTTIVGLSVDPGRGVRRQAHWSWPHSRLVICMPWTPDAMARVRVHRA